VQGTTAADIVRTEEGIEVQDEMREQIGRRIIGSRNYGPVVIEPLIQLNRYEVGKLAKSFGLPPELSVRQPFPVISSMTRESLRK